MIDQTDKVKNILKKVILFIIILAFIYGIGRLIVVTYDSYVFVPRAPYMVMQTKDSITIKWQSPKEEIGEVKYGFFSDKLDKSIFDKEAVDKHSLKITNLQECTKYFYSVSSESMEIDNENRSFSTLCSSANFQKLWVIGDSGKKGKGQDGVYKAMLDDIDNDLNKLDMWILLGDNAYKSGKQKEYNANLFKPYAELVKRFVPWAVIGNHDARRWAFYDIWDFPTNGESGGVASGSEKFYSIDNGNIHLVMLDSETADKSPDGAMANWLREDLKNNKKPWVIVAWHTPPYTDGGHKSDSNYDSSGNLKEMRENFVPIMDQFGVDLVLSGHSHGYERSRLMISHTGKSDTFDAKKYIVQDSDSCYTKPLGSTKESGTVYVVCGSSAKLDKAELNHPALPFSIQEMGSLIIDVTPTTLSSKFLTIDGRIADQFIIKKDKTTCGDDR